MCNLQLTNDAFKYEEGEVTTQVVAILTASGFVDAVSEEEAAGALAGLVLHSTSYYAESGGQVRSLGGPCWLASERLLSLTSLNPQQFPILFRQGCFHSSA